jgi:aspartyl-tRNA(Asn)/glutamyl-tRNA(Gln) amidotransferase subunit B
MKYADAVAKFDPVFGLETHVELSTNTKLFCPAHIEFGGEPNTQLTPVSLGLPGSLPVVNKTAIDYAIKLGLALHCDIAEWSQFARKNYFYPDMPRDYQISQYDKPLNGEGYLDVELEDGTMFHVPIERAHVEDDAGKNTHVGGADGRIEGADHSLVDYNRAGVPLIEIVTKPIEGAGARAPEIAGAYVRAIRDIVRALNISHARMEQGNMRADVNISLRRGPDDPLGTRSETKNVNSFRGIEKTIQYEIRRQAAILNEGGRFCRRPAIGTRLRSPLQAAVSNRMPTITATSLTPIWSWCMSPRSISRRCRPKCLRCRAHAATACRRNGASTTSRCAMCSTPTRSISLRRPSRPAPPPAARASGGSAN